MSDTDGEQLLRIWEVIALIPIFFFKNQVQRKDLSRK